MAPTVLGGVVANRAATAAPSTVRALPRDDGSVTVDAAAGMVRANAAACREWGVDALDSAAGGVAARSMIGAAPRRRTCRVPASAPASTACPPLGWGGVEATAASADSSTRSFTLAIVSACSPPTACGGVEPREPGAAATACAGSRNPARKRAMRELCRGNTSVPPLSCTVGAPGAGAGAGALEMGC